MKLVILCVSALLALWFVSQTTSQARDQKGNIAVAHFKSCPDDSQKQALRSSELQEIVSADQADRQIPGSQINWDKVSAADELRAKRVAEIFAEGCFKTAADYAAAALVFQHGVVPDHYYQAYLWSKQALELGDTTQKLMVANAIDRYLLSLGFKQLFGAQSFRNGPNDCHCLGPTEDSFSDEIRLQICGISLNDRMTSLQETNKNHPLCEAVIYCDKNLRSPPKGLFPGIW
jgi:hypothetical protein